MDAAHHREQRSFVVVVHLDFRDVRSTRCDVVNDRVGQAHVVWPYSGDYDFHGYKVAKVLMNAMCPLALFPRLLRSPSAMLGGDPNRLRMDVNDVVNRMGVATCHYNRDRNSSISQLGDNELIAGS